MQYIDDQLRRNANATVEQFLDIAAAAIVATPPMREVTDGAAMLNTRRAILKHTAPMLDPMTFKMLKPITDITQPHANRCVDKDDLPWGAEAHYICAVYGITHLMGSLTELVEKEDIRLVERCSKDDEKRVRAFIAKVFENFSDAKLDTPEQATRYEEMKQRYKRPDWARTGSAAGTAAAPANGSASGNSTVKANVKVASAKGKKKSKGKKASANGSSAQSNGQGAQKGALQPRRFDTSAWWMPDAM